MENKKNPSETQQQATRREFGKRAYMAPVILAAIKATESVASAQPVPAPAPPTVASVE